MLKHVLKYVSGELVGKALPFLTLPLFTRWLSVEEFGIIALYLVILQLSSEIFGIGVKGSYVRYIHNDKTDGTEFFSSTVFFLLLYSVGVLLLIYLVQHPLKKILDISNYVFWMGVLTGFLDSYFRLFLAKLEAEKKSKIHVRYNVARTIIMFSLGLFLVYYYNSEKYIGRIEGQVWAFGLMLLIVIVANRNTLCYKLKKEHIRYALVFGLPILLHQVSGFILNIFDQTMISSFLGKHELGIYSFAYRIAVIIQVLIMAVQKAWVPEFYDQMNKLSYKSIQQKFDFYSKGVLFVAVFLILFSNELYYFFAPKEYQVGIDLIPILIFSYVFYFLYAIYGQVLIFYKKNMTFSLITLISGLLNIGANYLLLPKYGIFGAALSTAASFFVLFLLNWSYCLTKFEKQSIIKLKAFVLDFLISVTFTVLTLLFLDFELTFRSFGLRLILLILVLVLLIKSHANEIGKYIRKL